MLGALTEGGYCSIGPTCAPGAMCSQIQMMGTVVNGVCVPVRFPVDLETPPVPVNTVNTTNTTTTTESPAILQGSDLVGRQEYVADYILLGGVALALYFLFR